MAVEFGATILDRGWKDDRSIVFCDFADRAALDERLRNKPRVTEGVWLTVSLEPCAVGSMFRR